MENILIRRMNRGIRKKIRCHNLIFIYNKTKKNVLEKITIIKRKQGTFFLLFLMFLRTFGFDYF